MPVEFQNVSEAAQEILNRLGSAGGPAQTVKLAAPLGLGKPNRLLNEFYARAKKDPAFHLKIYTALSLNPPATSGELAGRFLRPFIKRQWGDDYPILGYAVDAERGKLPKNVIIHEFYFKAGAALNSESLQKNYQSINYTRVAEAVYGDEVQVMVQMIAKRDGKYSLSCNPDVTLDLMDLYEKGGKSLLRVGVVHKELPFMGGDAEISKEKFDIILNDETDTTQLFALPRMPISPADHAIGFYASQLVADDGTLQIGIGSLSDAVVSALLFRHQNNPNYCELVAQSHRNPVALRGLPVETNVFEKGIYGLSEMVTDAYMHFRKSGILKREVVDEKSGARTFLHGAFFLGSKELYAWLRGLKGDDFTGLRMTRVSKVNDLYDPNEVLLRRQRKNGRFLNTCMQVTLLGGAASETLEDGRVISGVGGQYNFVAMSEELQGAHSVLMLRAVRESKGKRYSNIVWSHGHLTIPRHLRDIVITEYGIANLRNKTDEECIKALIEIADDEFQGELIAIAKRHRKLSQDYVLPAAAHRNNPGLLKEFIDHGKDLGTFKAFALGSDFTPEEEKIAVALERLKSVSEGSKLKLLGWILSALTIDPKPFYPELDRMGLRTASGLTLKLNRLLFLKALSETRE